MREASGPIPVGVMGLGFIGRSIAEAALSSPDLELVAALDAAPALAGKKLSEIVPSAPKHLTVGKNFAAALKALQGGVLLHATGSAFEKVLPELEAAARAGVHVVSTCEEFAYPWMRNEEKADALDALAQQHGVTLLGTGVNPGFVLDRLVATAGAAVGRVRRVRAERVVDALKRREALRKKVGVGLSEEEFARRAEAGDFGHVGLPESAALCAIGLGLDWDEFEEDLAPVIAEEDLPGVLKKGQVAGIHQTVRCFSEGREVVELELTIAAGMDDPHDLIEIEGTPRVKLVIPGGYAGDEATAWAVVNAAARVASAEPGILTVLELPAGR